MTHLRKMMLEELERRNYAKTTKDCYIQTIEDFARYFKRPPDQLGPEHIREYQAYLFRERKLAAHTVTQRLAGLRFFFIQTMKKPWSVADTPYPKKARHLPSILSPAEVALLIDSAQTRFHRIVLMTLYGTGVRRAELTRLQIADIDSRRMVIHIRGGKGCQDRDIMLSPILLEALRDSWSVRAGGSVRFLDAALRDRYKNVPYRIVRHRRQCNLITPPENWPASIPGLRKRRRWNPLAIL